MQFVKKMWTVVTLMQYHINARVLLQDIAPLPFVVLTLLPLTSKSLVADIKIKLYRDFFLEFCNI